MSRATHICVLVLERCDGDEVNEQGKKEGQDRRGLSDSFGVLACYPCMKWGRSVRGLSEFQQGLARVRQLVADAQLPVELLEAGNKAEEDGKAASKRLEGAQQAAKRETWGTNPNLANPTVMNLSIILAASSPQPWRVTGSMHMIIKLSSLKYEDLSTNWLAWARIHP